MIKRDKDIKYTICASIDLLGFSAHLEVGSDIRTSIGKSSIERLKILDNSINLLKKDMEDCPELYPKCEFKFLRINDGIYLFMDIDEVFLPEIGNTGHEGHTAEDLEELLPEDIITQKDQGIILQELTKKCEEGLVPIECFVSAASRVFTYINSQEAKGSFPGAKAVISSGFRRVYDSKNELDILSANFAFSNAYLAESQLHGNAFFIDSNITNLLAMKLSNHNILKLSTVFYSSNDSLFQDREYISDTTTHKLSAEVVDEKIDITLFRKKYSFIKLNPRSLGLLQIMSTLQDAKKIISDNKNVFANQILEIMEHSIAKEDLVKGLFTFGTGGIDFSIQRYLKLYLRLVSMKKSK